MARQVYAVIGDTNQRKILVFRKKEYAYFFGNKRSCSDSLSKFRYYPQGKYMIHGGGQYCFPGGGMTNFESELHAAYRELREETGLALFDGQYPQFEISFTKFYALYINVGGDFNNIFARIACAFQSREHALREIQAEIGHLREADYKDPGTFDRAVRDAAFGKLKNISIMDDELQNMRVERLDNMFGRIFDPTSPTTGWFYQIQNKLKDVL